MNNINDTIETILAAILVIALIVLILGFPLMWLWNWLMPTIFDLPEITFWQALGINLLSILLFKPSIKTNK
jgi:hypothetical protein